MADYLISKEAVQKMLIDLREHLNEHYISIGISMALQKMEGFKPADAVEVVRCMECTRSRPLNERERRIFTPQCMKCTNPHGCGVEYPEYKIDGRIVMENDYCSYGNRKPETKAQQICPNCGAKMDGGAEV